MNEQKNGDDGVLVSLDWLRKVDAAVFRGAPTNATTTGGRSLFYNVRLATIHGAGWSWDADAERWRCYVRFDDISWDSQPSQKAYLPWRKQEDGKPFISGRIWVVWRGRWDVLTTDVAREIGIGDCVGVSLRYDSTTNELSATNLGVLKAIVAKRENVSSDAYGERRANVCFSSDDFIGVSFAPGSGDSVSTGGNGWLEISLAKDYSFYAKYFPRSDSSQTETVKITQIQVAKGSTLASVGTDSTTGASTLFIKALETVDVEVVTNVRLLDDGTLSVTKTTINALA